MSTLDPFLSRIETSWPYLALLAFFAFYPVLSSIMWTTTSATYYWRRERGKKGEARPGDAPQPSVSVLVPCYCEEALIGETLRSCLALDYPDFEVVVVDDGSTDGSLGEILPFVKRGEVKLLAKARNEGKAMAINDAVPCLRGEIVFILDADSSPEPSLLRHVIPHFSSPRVAAVTGNPRVVEKVTFLQKLQAIEFTSIVSIQRRAQRVWGRVLTVSGVVAVFRKSAILDVGLFSPDMATEDIDITWKLQERYYDVRYEPE